MADRTSARRGLGVFFACLIAFSVLLELPAIRRIPGGHFISVYMWGVAAASFVARLVMREPLKDLSFRWGGWRAMTVATVFPLATGAAAYAIAWSTGLARFSASGIPEHATGVALGGPAMQRAGKYLLLSLTAGALSSCKSSAGEEIGWRGYMLLRLEESGVAAPVLVSALVWGLWHVPLILIGQYEGVPASFLPIALFVGNITAAGFVFAWLRLSSGSIWPCIWAHGLWNALVPGALAGMNSGGSLWAGEAGLLTMAAVALFAWALFSRQDWLSASGNPRSPGPREEREPQS